MPKLPVPPTDFRRPDPPQDVEVFRQPDYIVSYDFPTTLPAGTFLRWAPLPASDTGDVLANEVERVVAYNIYRGFTSGSEALVNSDTVDHLCYYDYITGTAACQYNDDTCIKTIGCYYQVSAVNAMGEGPRSEEVYASPTLPAGVLPTSKVARSDDGVKQGEAVLDDSGGSLGKDLSIPYDYASNTYASNGARSATLWMYGRSESCVPALGTQILTIQFNHLPSWYSDQSMSVDPCLHFGPADGWAAIDLPIDGDEYRHESGTILNIYSIQFILEDGPGTASTAFGVDGAGELMWLVEFSPLPAPKVFVGDGGGHITVGGSSCYLRVYGVMAVSNAMEFEFSFTPCGVLVDNLASGTMNVFASGTMTGTRLTGFQGLGVLGARTCTAYGSPFFHDPGSNISVLITLECGQWNGAPVTFRTFFENLVEESV